jgi:hypothetical protein
MDFARELGLNVLGIHPRERAFGQPCPLWNGQCSIYNSPEYPRFCRTYKCLLLKRILAETAALPEAMTAVEDAKRLIREIEPRLPGSPLQSFRERLETGIEDPATRRRAAPLLEAFRDVFGVEDIIDPPEEP